MGKIYFTSDLHLGHDKEFIYKDRGFNSIEEHDAAIIERWNDVITSEDDVYILGDLMMNDQDKGVENLCKLKGRIHFITGNHDTNTKIRKYVNDCHFIQEGYSNVFKYGKYHFYLSHYPTLTAYFDDKSSIKNHIINLHGHTHSLAKFEFIDNPFVYNVALDSHDFLPVSIDQVIEDIKTQYKSVCEIINRLNWECIKHERI